MWDVKKALPPTRVDPHHFPRGVLPGGMSTAAHPNEGGAAGPFLPMYFEGAAYNIPVSFITDKHPDGLSLVLPFEGQDITEAYMDAGHSKSALRMLRKWHDATKTEEEVRTILAELRNANEAKRIQRRKVLWATATRVLSVLSVVAAVSLYLRRKKGSTA